MSGGNEAKDLREVFGLLESRETHVTEDIKRLIQENLNTSREFWLIGNIVDYYYVSQSQTVVDILLEVREPHDKHLLEKLHDGLKSQDHQLHSLQLLLHVVCKQPFWLPKLVQTPVLKTILKCLKTEIDIPCLMTGVTIVTILLPSVPTLIGPYLPEIFEIFNRLASFSVKKPVGTIPDIFLLHLQVSVYALFHRLYGMFPYNFLAYLRHYYTKKENLPVFEEVVKNMLERVRLHPLLITGTKEHELSAHRWRQMETQDVVVECAKMSLDLVEGTWEELHCPIISSRYISAATQPLNLQSDFSTALRMPPVSCSAQAKLSPLLPQTESVPGGHQDSASFWSPSDIVGLSTPPPSQRTTPATSLLEAAPSSQHHAGPPVLTPLMTTPANTPRETPPISDEVDKEKIRHPSRSSLLRSSDPKRLSAEFSVNLSAVPLTPSSQAPSIPPSPLKAEFTSTPPLDLVKTLTVLHAARELQFDRPDQLEDAERSPEVGVSKTAPHDGIKLSGKPEFHLDPAPASLRDPSGETVSVNNLSHIIEGLESQVADVDDDVDDAEVSELTSVHSASSTAMLTAESVARFMKSVNRIRFNSLTASNSMDQIHPKFGSNSRSRSCPQLPKLDSSEDDDEEVEELSRSMSSTFQKASDTKGDKISTSGGRSEVKATATCQHDPQDVCNLSISSTSGSVTVNTKHDTAVTIATSQTSACLNISKCPMYPGASKVAAAAGGSEGSSESDFLIILRQLLNPASLSVCQSCQSRTSAASHRTSDPPSHAVTGTAQPLFSTCSPPELLDRHLKLGGEIHSKELSKIPIPSQQTVNWTHFGGVPPADEINILRGQLLLLHNQLMYERHKREQHAKRNRRLLRKIANAKTVEEQNAAMTDQLRQQDETVRNFQVSLRLMQADNSKLTAQHHSEEYQIKLQLSSCLQENEDLKAAKKEFNTLLVRQREEQDSLRQKLMQAESKLFQTEKERDKLREHVLVNEKLKEQVLQLHKELLLQGELLQKCQEKLHSSKLHSAAKLEQDHTIVAICASKKLLKKDCDNKTTQLENCQSRLSEVEESLKNKEISLSEIKRHLEDVKTSHGDELQAVEDKHQAVVRVNQQLEAHILRLYSELEELKSRSAHAIPRRRPPHDSGTPPEGSGPEQSRDEVEEPRDRTSSDPGKRPRLKEPLSRMGSAPVHGADEDVGQPQDGEDCLEAPGSSGATVIHGTDRVAYHHQVLHTTDSTEADYVEVYRSGEASDSRFLERRLKVERAETGSLSSRDSAGVLGSQLFTDSEDNRSQSNRSHTLCDSGYVG